MKKKKSKILNKLSMLLFFISLFLGFKINEQKKFIDIPSIGNWLPFEKWFFMDVPVINTSDYHHLINDIYTNGSNTCGSLFDGVILEVNETSIQVLSDNGILVVYGELDNVISKVDERVLKGQSMGTYLDSLTINFSKDNQKLTYEEAMKF